MERAGVVVVLLLGLIGLVAMLLLSGNDPELDPESAPEPDAPYVEPGLEVVAPPPPIVDVGEPPLPPPPPQDQETDSTPDARQTGATKTRGVVVDEDGKPVVAARVHYRKRFGSGEFKSVHVDPEGRFEIPWERRGTELVVFAAVSRTSFPMERVDVHGLVHAGRQDLELVAKRGETLTVRVTGFESGHPHPKIPVQICHWDRETRVYLRTVLGANGTASFSGIDPAGGVYLVHVGPAEVGRCARGEWRGGGGTLELELKPAAQIQGRVDTDWLGVRVTVIDATGFRFDTDVIEDDNSFEVDGIEPNLAWCFARAWVIGHFHKTPQVRCRPGDRDVVLKFDEEDDR